MLKQCFFYIGYNIVTTTLFSLFLAFLYSVARSIFIKNENSFLAKIFPSIRNICSGGVSVIKWGFKTIWFVFIILPWEILKGIYISLIFLFKVIKFCLYIPINIYNFCWKLNLSLKDTFKCPICNNVFSLILPLRQCSSCGNNFANKHVLSPCPYCKDKIKYYTCPYCNTSLSLKRGVNKKN